MKLAQLASSGRRRQRLQAAHQEAGVRAHECQRQRLIEVEVQRHVELVAVLVAEEAAHLLGLQIDLAHEDGIAPAAAQEHPQVAQPAVRVELDLAGDVLGLEQERHGVDAKAGKTSSSQKPDDLPDLLAHVRVGDVEVGLVL